MSKYKKTYKKGETSDSSVPDLSDTNRVLIILQALIEGSKTKLELVNYLMANRIEVSTFTLSRDIGKLRKRGYEIPKPTKRNQYLYQIVSVPFHLNFSAEEIAALRECYQQLVNSRSPDQALMAQFLRRLQMFLPLNERNLINSLLGEEPIGDAIRPILEHCKQLIRKRQQALIPYRRLRGEPRQIKADIVDLTSVDNYWYLIVFDWEYHKWLELRVDRIDGEIQLLPSRRQMKKSDRPVQYALFRLYPPLSKAYRSRVGEQIFPDKKYTDCLLIKTPYISELRFVQRILRYEQYAEILEPPALRMRLQNSIMDMFQRYAQE
jgi:predicted DNA-binding transcriptional regulator YafY